MPPRLTDAQNRALIKRAIAYAESQAASDADFVQILRATYFTQHPDIRRRFPQAGRGGRGRGGSARPTADPSFHIYEDPRFLANARILARRAQKNLRIMGGSKVAAKDFPDCVAVGKEIGDDVDWQCTGTLIAPTVVISAGHCSRVATHVFFGIDVTRKGTRVAVDRRVRHPDYNKAKNHDLLLLILEKPVKVKPRRIASSDLIAVATDGRAVGFGNVDATGQFGYGMKRQVDLPIASPSCTGKVGGQSDKSAYGCDRDLEMVAGKPLLGRDSCSGDSGGPFYLARGNSWLLAGATSRSTKSAMSTCGDGGIYARVDQYREWIEDTANVKLP